MASTNENLQLSLLASFDDGIRSMKAIFDSIDENFNGPILMAREFEKTRQNYQQARESIRRKDEDIAKLKKDVHLLNLHLQTVRQAYSREMKKRDIIQKDYNQLRKKLATVQELLNEDRGGRSSPDSVLSILGEIKGLKDLPPMNESKESDDGLLFDKTEDSFDEDHHQTKIKIRKIEPEYAQLNPTFKNFAPQKTQSNLGIKMQMEFAVDTNALENIVEEEAGLENCLNLNNALISNDFSPNKQFLPKAENILPFPSSKSVVSINRQKSDNYMSKLNRVRQGVKYDDERLNTREHTFQQKKAFKPSVICTSCSKNIGFCSNYFVCIDCRGITHASQRCQSQLPKPCIPYTTSSAGLKKMQSSANVGHIIMLSDFTIKDSRPCVPALLIHCCNELNQRIDDASNNPKYAINSDSSPVLGLYRVNAIEKEIRELRVRILEGKGIPNLANINSHLICGVVKTFLRDLDDPVVTRIMWHDFVRSAEHVQQFAEADGGLTDSDYESHHDEEPNEEWYDALRVLKGVIVQLPNVNRDSLSFIFLHFWHLLEFHAVVKMDVEGLSQIFGPTIVGFSRPQTGTLRMSSTADACRENEKQVMVMKALFKLSRNFWDGLLKNPNYCPFETILNDRKSLNTSILQKRVSTSAFIQGNKPRDPIY